MIMNKGYETKSFLSLVNGKTLIYKGDECHIGTNVTENSEVCDGVITNWRLLENFTCIDGTND